MESEEKKERKIMASTSSSSKSSDRANFSLNSGGIHDNNRMKMADKLLWFRPQFESILMKETAIGSTEIVSGDVLMEIVCSASDSEDASKKEEEITYTFVTSRVEANFYYHFILNRFDRIAAGQSDRIRSVTILAEADSVDSSSSINQIETIRTFLEKYPSGKFVNGLTPSPSSLPPVEPSLKIVCADGKVVEKVAIVVNEKITNNDKAIIVVDKMENAMDIFLREIGVSAWNCDSTLPLDKPKWWEVITILSANRLYDYRTVFHLSVIQHQLQQKALMEFVKNGKDAKESKQVELEVELFLDDAWEWLYDHLVAFASSIIVSKIANIESIESNETNDGKRSTSSTSSTSVTSFEELNRLDKLDESAMKFAKWNRLSKLLVFAWKSKHSDKISEVFSRHHEGFDWRWLPRLEKLYATNKEIFTEFKWLVELLALGQDLFSGETKPLFHPALYDDPSKFQFVKLDPTSF